MTEKQKQVTFDVMLHDMFVCTLRMPITLDVISHYENDTPVIKYEKIMQYVEQKRPTLKNKPYKVFFCENKPKNFVYSK